MEKPAERGSTIVFSKEETKIRSSPPPLVSIANSKRDSLVGLQRLVYGSHIFSSTSSCHNGTPPIAVIGESVANSQDLGTRSTGHAHLECAGSRLSSQKAKRSRTSFTPGQLERLEDEFQIDMYVVGLKRMKLANDLSLSERQVKVWFQNRRMKYKRERSRLRNCEEGK